MTKPNDFILNSDYLALAQTNKSEFTAIFPAESFQPGYPYDRTQDFTVPYSPGAIDLCMVSINGGDYVVGSSITLSMNYPILIVTIMRVDSKTMRVNLHEFNSRTGGYDMPMQTVKVKVASFKPPNVF